PPGCGRETGRLFSGSCGDNMPCVPVFTDPHSFGKSAAEINPHLYGRRTPRTPNAPVVDKYGAENAPPPSRHGRCTRQALMITILCIVGGVWLGGSALLMFALALAAKRPTPSHEAATELKQAA